MFQFGNSGISTSTASSSIAMGLALAADSTNKEVEAYALAMAGDGTTSEEYQLVISDSQLNSLDNALHSVLMQGVFAKKALATGGYSAEAYALARNGVDMAYKTINLAFEHSSVDSIGNLSFDEASERLSATTELANALAFNLGTDADFGNEGFKETAGKTKEAVKQFIATIMKFINEQIAKVKGFFDKHFSDLGKIEKGIPKMQEKVKGLEGDAGTDKFKLGALAGKLTVDGKTFNKKAVGLMDTALTKFAKDSGVTKAIEALIKAMNDTKADDEAGVSNALIEINKAKANVAAALVKSLEAKVSANAKDVGVAEDSYADIKASAKLAGGVQFIVGVPKEDSKQPPMYKVFVPEFEKAGDIELAPLDKKGMDDALKDTLALVKTLRSMQTKASDNGKQAAKLVEAVKSLGDKLGKSEVTGEKFDDLKSVISDVRAMAKVTNDPTVDMVKAATKTAKASLAYVGKSVGAFKSK